MLEQVFDACSYMQRRYAAATCEPRRHPGDDDDDDDDDDDGAEVAISPPFFPPPSATSFKSNHLPPILLPTAAITAAFPSNRTSARTSLMPNSCLSSSTDAKSA